MTYRSLLFALSVGLALPPSPWVAFAEEPSATSPGTSADAPPSAPAAPAATTPPQLEKLDRVRGEQIESDKAAHASQERINRIDDETQKMLAEYRKAVAEKESYEAYADQLTRQIESQNDELVDIGRQLDEIEETSRSIVPLEQKMLATLGQFVELDVPFLLKERRGRIATLQAMMDRADVSISEKYRRILEAYQVEMDYGRTIETYDGKLTDEGSSERTARFLRIGRVSLLYQTLDGGETGYWDNRARRWVVDSHYAHAFKEGIGVANKTTAPEMLSVPVPSPEEVKS